MRYWLHRITGGDNALGFAHPLLFTHHYLSIGWSDLSSDAFVRQVQAEGETAIDSAMQAKGWGLPKNRWNLWRFIMEMKKGDVVLVPTSQEFSLFEILDDVIFSNQQIKAYKTNHTYDDYHMQMWVISTCEHYSQKAMNEADEAGVRLITGIEFASMILDAGIEGFFY